jgi:mannose-1-phosphate guanylyltransferase
VHRGRAIEAGVYEVKQFKEKPPLETATQYVSSGEYYWNSGMFVWRCSAFLDQLAKHLPDSHEKLGRIAAADGTEQRRRLEALYPTLTKISVDFAVMEKADRCIVVEMPVSWLDVGSWTALCEIINPDAEGNVATAAQFLALDSANNILVAEGDHLIATIGVKDLVIVAGPKATLVCHRDQVQRIKEMVSEIEKAGLVDYL